MSLYYDKNAPETLQDIADTLDDYACSMAHDLNNLHYVPQDKESDDADRLWASLDDKAESLQYLANKLHQISDAFTIINRMVYNPSGEWVRK